MTDDFYKKAFDSAVEELSVLTEKLNQLRDEIETTEDRAEKVRQGALGLAALAGIEFQEIKEKHADLFAEQIDSRMGITDAVREALRSSDDALTPREVRDRVLRISPSIAGHSNPLASIHAILRRLMDADEIVSFIDSSDRTMYGWVPLEEDVAMERLSRWILNPEKTWKRIQEARKKKK